MVHPLGLPGCQQKPSRNFTFLQTACLSGINVTVLSFLRALQRKNRFVESLLQLFTADCSPAGAAQGTGEQRQVPIPGLHLLHGGARKFLDLRNRIGKSVACCICKLDRVAWKKAVQCSKMSPSVVPRNDQVVQIVESSHTVQPSSRLPDTGAHLLSSR